jgi:DNA-binding YbaB/EbfC family protein
MAKNMNNLLKQAQQMQQKMSTLQKELEAREMEFSSGGGMVKIKINGKQEILELKLNKRMC